MNNYEFKTIISNDGLFISVSSRWNSIEALQINGKYVTKTFHRDWYFLEGESSVETVSRNGGMGRVNERYELMDSKTFPNLKKQFSLDEVKKKEYSEDGEYEISFDNIEFSKISSLYQYKYDEVELPRIEIPFTQEVILSIEKIDSPVPFEYKAVINSFSNTNTKLIKEVSYATITEITVPEILRHNYPCYLTSLDSYNIIRSHILDNINSLHAEVTSNYTFCFEVCKKYYLQTPEIISRELKTKSGKSFSKPKFTYSEKKYNKVKVFEMTNLVDKYKGYTVIDGFKGNTLQELKDNIDNYLEELMRVINAPVKYCECCNGSGISSNNVFELPNNKI